MLHFLRMWPITTNSQGTNTLFSKNSKWKLMQTRTTKTNIPCLRARTHLWRTMREEIAVWFPRGIPETTLIRPHRRVSPRSLKNPSQASISKRSRICSRSSGRAPRVKSRSLPTHYKRVAQARSCQLGSSKLNPAQQSLLKDRQNNKRCWIKEIKQSVRLNVIKRCRWTQL